MAGSRSTETFSIFGQCERVAAEMLIKEGKASRIEAKFIPPSVAVNEDGVHAAFAVVVKRKHIRRFEELISDLHA